jgi:hypothetical protein
VWTVRPLGATVTGTVSSMGPSGEVPVIVTLVGGGM